jgi:hypothetical protein
LLLLCWRWNPGIAKGRLMAAFFDSSPLFSGYQAGVKKQPNFFAVFGWEVLCDQRQNFRTAG